MKKLLVLAACSLLPPYAGAHSVTLTWKQSKSDGIAHDRVYCGHQSGGPYPQRYKTEYPETQVTKFNAQPGDYYCVVTAINQDGYESKPSNEVHVVVPKN